MNRIKEALTNLQEKKLDKMNENIRNTLAKKAAEKLEEMKVDLASSYFDRK